MLIDIGYAIVLLVAIYKGWKTGLIGGAFSLLSFIIGLAAAIKLSGLLAQRLEGHLSASSKWLPFLAFIVIFLIVALLVKLTGSAIQKAINWIIPSWINSLAGSFIYVILFSIVFSVFLFFFTQLHLIKQPVIGESLTYGYIQPFANQVFNKLGSIIPWLKNGFGALQHFFEGFPDKINHK